MLRKTLTHRLNGAVAFGDGPRLMFGFGNCATSSEIRLTSLPLGCALAPESEELGTSVRHLILGRYRILFIVEKRTVTILHVRGSYVDPSLGEASPQKASSRKKAQKAQKDLQ